LRDSIRTIAIQFQFQGSIMRIFTASLVLVSAMAVLTLPQSAQAADTDGNYAVRGAGSMSCSDFTKSVDSADENIEEYLSWVQGNLSAHSRLMDDTFDVLPIIQPTAIGVILYNVCVSNPESTIEGASTSLINFMKEGRVRSMSEIIQLRNGESATALRQETLLRVRERLSEEGYLEAAGEDVTGPELRDALVAFQGDNALVSTGLPDPDTIIRLLLP
jgi:hypothetical protein